MFYFQSAAKTVEILQVLLQEYNTSLQHKLFPMPINLSMCTNTGTGCRSNYQKTFSLLISVSCKLDYTYNPESMTCYKLVKSKTDWYQANESCSAIGGYLATFPTAAASQWFRDQLPTLLGTSNICKLTYAVICICSLFIVKLTGCYFL